MTFVGISCGFHDGAISIVDNFGNILFAGHSERYSKIKHDKHLSDELLKDAIQYVDKNISVHYYEKPLLKYLRQLRSGESTKFKNLFLKNILGQNFFNYINVKKIYTHGHHKCHAAAGFQTSPFNKATVVIIDAIGEFDTVTIWGAEYFNHRAVYKKFWTKKYPNSLGLFYSAMTQRVGLKPLDEEYILMGMAGWGKPIHKNELQSLLIDDLYNIEFTTNLHTGISDTFLRNANDIDIASSTQELLEDLIANIMQRAKKYNWSNNLVYGGGVALNCLANRNLSKWFNKVWIMPNPGDAGSSLGAAALGYGGKLNWENAYLGYNISRKYPLHEIVEHLLAHKIVGVANGRAEFGPRALGNRSLLADPRGSDIKDRVNKIKRRQQFRPFAPVILEEFAHEYFDMPNNWIDMRYMQIVAKCLKPNFIPAVVHIDGTSRIQTVPKDGSNIRSLLELWYKKTGCPLLLNTSLNIRGEPMVNDINDARRFENFYGVKVFA